MMHSFFAALNLKIIHHDLFLSFRLFYRDNKWLDCFWVLLKFVSWEWLIIRKLTTDCDMFSCLENAKKKNQYHMNEQKIKDGHVYSVN